VSNPFIRDAQAHPDLFDLRLPATPSEIAALEGSIRAKLPAAFAEVLEVLGQGSFFDSETLLGVHEADEGVGDLEQVNRELHDKQGLDDSLIVFHIGTHGLHAFDTQSGGAEHEVVTLDGDTLVRGAVYDGFEAWYEERIRPEYKDLLGLD
jgi:hypothetical protein